MSMAKQFNVNNTIQNMTTNAKRIHTKISVLERSDIDVTSAKMWAQPWIEHVDHVVPSHATISHHSASSSATTITRRSLHTRITFQMAITLIWDSPFDIIIALPSHIVDNMFNNSVHVFLHPWLYFPPIPPHIRHVWIYEDGPIMDGITVMLTLNQNTLPDHLYFITNPLYTNIMESHYDFSCHLIPRSAPVWILCRFHNHLMRIW
jgi:hypothetical protein